MAPGLQCAGGGDTNVPPCMWFTNYTFISGCIQYFLSSVKTEDFPGR